MNSEIWKDIEGYEGLYQISNYGNVKTLPRPRVKSTIMKLELHKGYYKVCFSKNNKSKHFFVHRLVAQAFIPNPDNLPCVNHKDENSLNNCVNNLEWCTQQYNLLYGNRRAKVIEKERKPVGQYTMSNELIRVHYSIQQAARNINRNAGPICRCCKGKQAFAYGYKWEYYNKGGGAKDG